MNELTRAIALICVLLRDLVPEGQDPASSSIMKELRALSVTLLERSRSAAGYDVSSRGMAALARADQVEDKHVFDLVPDADEDDGKYVKDRSKYADADELVRTPVPLPDRNQEL